MSSKYRIKEASRGIADDKVTHIMGQGGILETSMGITDNSSGVRASLGTVNTVAISARIVSAYVSKNAVGADDLTTLVRDVHDAVYALGEVDDIPASVDPRPAIARRKSVTPDFIICLEDGKKFKSLKRHLSTTYNLSPDEYRAKWGLPPSYPMVAPNYSAARSLLAKRSGLGRKTPASAPRSHTKTPA